MRGVRWILLALAVIPSLERLRADDLRVACVTRPPTDRRNPNLPGPRPPLQVTPFVKLPVGAIVPAGWLRRQLELEADGFTGHLTELSRFLDKEGNAWLSPTGRGDHGWEEVPYWLKGYLNLAYVLKDPNLIAEARVWVEGALASQKSDGWFGPDQGRQGAATRLQGREDLWPNAIMLFCLQDYHEATGDRRVLDLMTHYFAYLRTVPEERFLVGYWPKMRGGDLLLSVLWLYNRTGEAALLDLADKVHRHTARWDEDVINWHNVNMAQAFGQPGTYWLRSGAPADLAACERNDATIRRLYGRVPGGMFGGDENCRPGYDGPRQAIETCGIVEAMLSHETLLWITGRSRWADRCEDAAYNSLPASMTADLKALRYLTAPNQVISDRRSKSPGVQNGGPMFQMNPHSHRCCQHNSGHGWPYLAEHLWLATADRGLAAVLYAASTVTAPVADGRPVTLHADTHYPFDGTVTLAVTTASPVTFPLYLRIPGWCEGAGLRLNGHAVAVTARPGQYLVLTRAWQDGDRVTLELPLALRVTHWQDNRGTWSVAYGPLTFSLRIGERYERSGGTDAWPAWDILPETPWNYGLELDPRRPAAAFAVDRRPWPADDRPFTQEGTPLILRARGRRIPHWTVDGTGLIQEVQPGPIRSDEPVEPLTLIPMGAARLRLTAFPRIARPGEAGRDWQPLPEPQASHVHDRFEAIQDGRIPADSGDHSLPRFTWWDHRGTAEWVNLPLPEVQRVSRVRVYWFDDTGRGQCRIPQSWSVLYEDTAGHWQPVEGAVTDPVTVDRFNASRFRPVRTGRLRIAVQLRDGFSGGILEAQVE